MGRRRHLGPREPSGRLARSRPLQRLLNGHSPAEVRRALDAVFLGLRDPQWGSTVGRLALTGKLTPPEVEVARRWAQLASLYRQALAAPKVANSAWEHRVHTNGHAILPPGTDTRDRAIVIAMNEARAAILADEQGKRILATLHAVVEEGSWPRSADEHHRLHAGLTALAQHWRLAR